LRWALYALVASVVVIGLLTFPPGAPLRDPETGAIIGNSPFMNSLIVQIMLVFLAIGAAYGVGAGTVTSMVDGINAVTKTFSGLSGLIFLLFVISQFLAYFTFSNMATIVAVNMGDALEHANLGTIPLMLGFITVTGNDREPVDLAVCSACGLDAGPPFRNLVEKAPVDAVAAAEFSVNCRLDPAARTRMHVPHSPKSADS
jgi:p-aminobenzoyl-glutamate transporter AbgT